MDRQQRIWFLQILTNRNGEYTFRPFTTEDGLINNSVRCISEDKEGYLWITTTNGLSRFNPNNNSFFNYTRKDGLLSNQFYWNAICRAANGDLYVGSTKGLSVVKPVIDTNPKELFLWHSPMFVWPMKNDCTQTAPYSYTNATNLSILNLPHWIMMHRHSPIIITA